ncbi:translocation/assembly module TamB domain-containing protein [Roseimarinus sediminis]|uniref:translocation/assembly module TamB domain-containing protein n=1 Tax=Roseimarinus sediminis TaxID=1610899 RepID=UPI003D21DFCA
MQTKVIALITQRISSNTQTDISIRRVNISFFRKVILDDFYMSDLQGDTLLHVDRMIADIDSLSIRNKSVGFRSLLLEKPLIQLKHDTTGFNFDFLKPFFERKDTVVPEQWQVDVRQLAVEDARFAYTDSLLSDDVNNFLKISGFNLIIDDIVYWSDNDFECKISEGNFISENQLELKKLEMHLRYKDSLLALNHIHINTAQSELFADTVQLNLSAYLSSKKVSELDFNMGIEKLSVDFSDIAFLLGTFHNNDFVAEMSGNFSGTMAELRGKEVQLSIGDFTRLNGDFYLNGLPDIASTYIFFNLNESYANLREIRHLDLPDRIQQAIDDLPYFLDNVGVFSYRGNFTGFIDDFVAYGTAYSNLGTLSTDVSFKPSRHENISVSGHVNADKLDIRTIFDNNKLGFFSFNGDVNGTLNYASDYDLDFKGVVNSIDFNAYTFTSIDVNGSLQNDQFNGKFRIEDPNIYMDYSGKLDLSPALPVFEFVANIEHINLDRLKLLPDEQAVASLKIDANFEGNNIDNVKGRLLLTEISYHNAVDRFEIDTISLQNSPGEVNSLFSLRSDIVDGEIKGHYNFINISKSLKRFYDDYLPSSQMMSLAAFDDVNDFNYSVRLKNIEPVIKAFLPDFYLEPNVEISGYYKPMKDSVLLETHIPMARYGGKGFEGVRLRLNGNGNRLFGRLYSQRIRLSEYMSLYNLSINGKGREDQLAVDVFWNNYEESTYSGAIKTLTTFEDRGNSKPHVEVAIAPTNLYFNDTLWTIEPSTVIIDSSDIRVNNFMMKHNKQRISIDGTISKRIDEFLTANIDNVDLLLFEPALGRSKIGGVLNGRARLADYYNKFMLNMNFNIDHFALNYGELGMLTVNSNWDTASDKLVSEVNLQKGSSNVFNARGLIDPSLKELDFELMFDRSPVSILEVILPSTFYNQDGLVDGEVHLHGPFKHILIDGDLTPVDEASFGISYLNTTYYFSDPVSFRSDSILFDQMTFRDNANNRGRFNGYIIHETFYKMRYNLTVDTDRIMALNTTSNHNEYFYGDAFASGHIEIVGAGNDIFISGDVRSEKGTSINIPFDSGENAKQYDFIEFVGTRQTDDQQPVYDVVTSGLNMNFDVDITPEARVQIIFNSQIGDIIRGEGNGDLQVRVDKNYNIYLYGNYEIENGDYLFTLQNVINKRFSIERGSTIEWVGDPYNAIIDILARYKVKTSLHDLFVGNYENIDLTRRIPVDCVIHLTDNLTQPKIDFNIELPTAEERVKDEVSQVIVTQEDINKQIISLLMMGRFYTPEVFAGRPTTEAGAQLVGATASELISNQLTNWLSQISDAFDVGINYRPGNEITDDQLELALSTQVLNERVTINGNIANNANPTSNNNSEIIGDFDMNIKLTDNGKLQFKFYNHSNDNLIYDTAPYTQGIGFTYREEFNSIKQLLERYKTFVFGKNKKKHGDKEIKKEE